MIHRYLLIALFGAGLLVGIQAPNFADQYARRIDAHYLEVVENLKAFQEIADRFHGGDLQALIKHHRASQDSTFNAEAAAIERMADRKARFGKERDALQGKELPQRAAHILFLGDREITQETWATYSPELRLNREAVFSGIGLALAACLLLEALLFSAKRSLGMGARAS